MSVLHNAAGGLLYRVKFFRRPVSATSGMVWAHAAKWVFRQMPKRSDADRGFIAFEVSTRRHPYAAKEALAAAIGKEGGNAALENS